MPLTGGVDGTLQAPVRFRASGRRDPADGLQQGTVDVSFDGGTTWTNLLTRTTTTAPTTRRTTRRATKAGSTSTSSTSNVNNPAGGTAQFRFGYLDAGNDWWWAVTNIKVTDNKTDPSTLTANLATAPTHGTLNLVADGSFTYTANAGYTGPDSFTYTARATGLSRPRRATVSIQVNANNTVPVAVNDTYSGRSGHDT